MLVTVTGSAIDAGPAAYYSPSYDGAGWHRIYDIHANAGRAVGPPTYNNRWCVHPNYDVVGKRLLLRSGDTEIVCTTGDMVKQHHKPQWRAKWGIEVSWSLWNELGDPGYVQVYGDWSETLYFPETDQAIAGAFTDYWLDNGGVEIFGFPISRQFSCDVGTCQMFERARFELDGDGQVRLGRIGAEIWDE